MAATEQTEQTEQSEQAEQSGQTGQTGQTGQSDQSEQTEIERKYEVDRYASVPDLTVVDGVAAVETRAPVTLSAVYFDTERYDLAAHLITLRRREGGDDEGWHIKKPVVEGRTELHWPLHIGRAGSEGAVVPDEVLAPVRALVRDRPLVPVARISTVRTAVHLLNERGAAVAELADDEVQASDVRSGQLRAWREWEVEFLGAAPDTLDERAAYLDAVEKVLETGGARPSRSRSKAAQALGVDSLGDLAGADAAGSPARGDAGSAASVVVAAIGRLVDALHRADPPVRADKPDSVHQMRRVVRKLRSVLAVYRRLFDEERVNDLRDRLKKLGSALGEARDAEVRRDRSAKELDALPSHRADARERLVGGDGREYAEALGRVQRLLEGSAYFRLLDVLDEFVAAAPVSARGSEPARTPIRKALAQEVRRLRKRTDAAEAADIDREAALHAVRRAARRLRYAVNAVVPDGGGGTGGHAPGAASDKRGATTDTRGVAGVGDFVPGKKYRKLARAAKPVEKALGDHRDSVLFAEHVQRAAQRAQAEGEDTFVYGLLTGRSEFDEDDLLADLHRAVRDLEERADKI